MNSSKEIEAPDGDLGKLQSVELIRFLAAFSVVVWHYQSYFLLNTRDELPLSQFLSIFYNSGLYAVQWFWVLSGYVFFFNYCDAIHNRTMTGLDFFSRRLARLYPLHLLTLLATSLLLLEYKDIFGSEYPHYTKGVTVWTFVSQLFMASNWMTTEQSFNGPIWSVSVEVLIYFLFFVLTAYGRIVGIARVLSVVITCSVLYHFASTRELGTLMWIAECTTCFYLGGVVHYMRKRYALDMFGGVRQALFWAILAAAVFVFYWYKPSYTLPFLLPASAILFVVSSDTIAKSSIVTKVARVGNWTYSSYLLHFPITLLIIIGSRLAGIDIFGIAKQPAFLLAYCVGLFSLADFCYTFFEVPARRTLRLLAKKRVNIVSGARRQVS